MIRNLLKEEFPQGLFEIPEPPKQLRVWGTLPPRENKLLAVVGSRKYSHYGRESCEELIAGLTDYPITIVSGLALGIDSLAHKAALRYGLQTLALPGSGLDPKVLHPRSHVPLAHEIVDKGGGLMSEYDDLMPAGMWTFPRRNRIMAGLCDAVLVIEAERKSGTLITSRLATEYNKEVGAVPGPISSPTSEGPHLLLQLGASLVRSSSDILEMLRIDSGRQHELFDTDELNNEEKKILELLKTPMERDELTRKSGLNISEANAILSLMEIKGLIKEELGEVRKLI